MGKPGEGVGEVDERDDTEEALLAEAREIRQPIATPRPGDEQGEHPPGHHAPSDAGEQVAAEGGRPAERRRPEEGR
jgi:hypothetical protein